jgi:uncharacterized protein YraI
MITKKIAALCLAAVSGAGALTTAATLAQAQGTSNAHVSSKSNLSVRYAPSTHARQTASLKPGAKISVDCLVYGTKVDGNKKWYKINGNRSEWVPARYVAASTRIFECWGGTGGEYLGKTTAKLTVRFGPNTKDGSLRTLASGTKLAIGCKVSAQTVDGNRYWYAADGGWVSARYVKNTKGVPTFC